MPGCLEELNGGIDVFHHDADVFHTVMAMLLRRLLRRHSADRPLGPASQQLTLTSALLRRLFAYIKSIARAVGFTGPSHFAAAFRQRVGASPSAWREQRRH